MRFFCFCPPFDSPASQRLNNDSRLAVMVFMVFALMPAMLVGPVLAQSTAPSATAPDLLNAPPRDEDTVSVSTDGGLPSDPLVTAGILLDALAQAEDGQTADDLAREIQGLWNRSGSDAVDVLMLRAGIAMRSNHFSVALDLLDTVIALAPDYAEGWNRRATVHFMRDDYSSSIADVQRVLRLQPRHFGALVGIGMILDDLGEDRQAARFLREALSVHPFLSNARERLTVIDARLQGTPI